MMLKIQVPLIESNTFVLVLSDLCLILVNTITVIFVEAESHFSSFYILH